MEYRLDTPLKKEALAPLRAGDTVWLSGEIYTARDAAHQRMAERIGEGKPLPFSLDGACIYYAGPTPAPPGRVIGAVGPTTSGRMDRFTPLLLANGLCAMIGKGQRSAAVAEAIVRYRAVYFGFVGGLGALAAACVTRNEPVAWEDLGSEAVHRLTVDSLPLVVLIDTQGNDLYKIGPKAYAAARAQSAEDRQKTAPAGGKVTTVDEYVASLSGEGRAWAEAVVRYLRDNCPGASEGLSYKIPTFRSGQATVAFSAGKGHFTLQVGGAGQLDDLKAKMPYATFGKTSVKVPLVRTDARPELLIKMKQLLQ